MVDEKTLSKLENRIKRRLRKHLLSIGFNIDRDWKLTFNNGSKDAIRLLHSEQRRERIIEAECFLSKKLYKVIDYFASGNNVEPSNISPRLEIVKSGTLEADIFRVATMTWSIPVSEGYGRRMRFLLWDDYNNKVIGIIALGDPVFNIRARDDFVGWGSYDRKERLVNVMDAYVLGSLPPYNKLLGGKLVACAVRSKEVRDAFRQKYGKTCGFISGKEKNPRLVMVTTTSALGRSSVYNRLSLGGIKYFESIGYTSGYGHFHVNDEIFKEMRLYLRLKGHPYCSNNQFGNGANWKLRAIRATFGLMGINCDLLNHGVERELFACYFASNAKHILRGEQKRPRYNTLLSLSEISTLAKERWIIPRAYRKPEYKYWEREKIQIQISINCKSI